MLSSTRFFLLAGLTCLPLCGACGVETTSAEAGGEIGVDPEQSDSQEPQAETPAEEPPAPIEVVDLEVAGVRNLHQAGSIYTAGQHDEAGLRALQERGVRTVVNLRFPAETPDMDQGALAEELGLAWESRSFNSPETMTDELIAEVCASLSDESKHPLLLHCASANRVGAIWYVHRMLDHGIESEQAESEAREIGLRSDALLARANEYLAAQGVELGAEGE